MNNEDQDDLSLFREQIDRFIDVLRNFPERTKVNLILNRVEALQSLAAPGMITKVPIMLRVLLQAMLSEFAAIQTKSMQNRPSTKLKLTYEEIYEGDVVDVDNPAVISRLSLKSKGDNNIAPVIRMYHALKEFLKEAHNEALTHYESLNTKKPEVETIKDNTNNWSKPKVQDETTIEVHNKHAREVLEACGRLYQNIKTPDDLDKEVFRSIQQACLGLNAEASYSQIASLKNEIYPLADILKRNIE